MKYINQEFHSYNDLTDFIYKNNEIRYFNSEIPCVDYVIDILEFLSPIQSRKLVKSVRGKNLLTEAGGKALKKKNRAFLHYASLNKLKVIESPEFQSIVFFKYNDKINHCGIFLEGVIHYLHPVTLKPTIKIFFNEEECIFLSIF